MVFSAESCSFLHIFDLSLDQTGDADFRTDLDLAASHLGIVACLAQLTGLLYLAVTRTLSGFVVSKHLNRHLAGMEAFAAGSGIRLFVFLADFVLEAAAFEILVEAFVGDNRFAHFYFSSSPVTSRMVFITIRRVIRHS